jgi:hypothetical protein
MNACGCALKENELCRARKKTNMRCEQQSLDKQGIKEANVPSNKSSSWKTRRTDDSSVCVMMLRTCLANTRISSLNDSEEQMSPPGIPASRGVQVASSHFSKMSANSGNKGCLCSSPNSPGKKE